MGADRCPGEEASRLSASWRILHGRRFPRQRRTGLFRKDHENGFPDRPIVDIPNDDPIFHTVFDLNDRYRITGAEHLDTGYKKDGRVARWEGIYDDKGRIMVAISLNSDIGDSWEWSDDQWYPAEVFRPRNPRRRKLRGLRHDPLKSLYDPSIPLPDIVTTIRPSVTQEQWLIPAKPLFSSTSGDSPRNISSILSGEGFDAVERGESPLAL